MGTLLLRLVLLITLALTSLHPFTMRPWTTMEITMGVVLICSKALEQAVTSTLFFSLFQPLKLFPDGTYFVPLFVFLKLINLQGSRP